MTNQFNKNINIAFLHDWLNGMRGGEKVLSYIIDLFPKSPIHTLHSDLSQISKEIQTHPIHNSFINRLPFKKKYYRYYLPFFPLAIKSMNLNGYDLLFSTSHCAVKNVTHDSKIPHISYCFSPMRYIWELQDDYFGRKSLKTMLMKPCFDYLKYWDKKNSDKVTSFIAVSKTIQQRIKRCYGRESTVIYPPCDLNFSPHFDKKDYILVLSALTPYKKIDIAIKAAQKLNLKLKIAGTGPEIDNLKKIAESKVEFLGWVSEKEKTELLKHARCLLFPGLEDFGIVPLEAMSFCTPVIGYGQGGLTETVVHEKTGFFSKTQNLDDFCEAIDEGLKIKYHKKDFENTLQKFSIEEFQKKIIEHISDFSA